LNIVKKIRKAAFTYLPNVLKTTILRRAPALFGIVEMNPTSCNIMITTRCNLKCVMCKQWRIKPGEELNTDEWKRVIGELYGYGIRNVHFTGGEPLLRSDLEDLIRYASGLGMVVGMTTNGILIGEEKLTGMVGAGLASIAVSVDALGPGYEKIRGMQGSFSAIEKAVGAISSVRRRLGIDAYINFTLMRESISALKSVKKFADKAGLPLGICLLDKSSSIFDVAENKKTLWIDHESDSSELAALREYLKSEMTRHPGSILLSFSGIDYISGYFKDPRQPGIPCAISQDRIFIDPYGGLFGGCLSMGTFGSLKDERIGALLESDKYKAAKKRMFYKMCAGCSCGYMYNIRHMPGLLIGDLLKGAFLTGLRRGAR